MKLPLMLAVLPALALAACNKDDTATVSAPVKSIAAAPAPAGTAWADVVAPTPQGGMRMGNPDAPIKLIEYGARTCPTCARFDAEGLPALKSGMIASGKVSYEFRDFPVHGPLDIGPILLGQCVEPAAFFPMLEDMMRNQQTLLAKEQQVAQAGQALQGKPPMEVARFFAENLGYIDFVKQRGVPESKALACLADQAAIARLAANLQQADTEYKVSGTPTFIVNGKIADGVLDWKGLEGVLRAAGA
ncbi:MAG: protein-disulfide isomerase [Sphingomonas sp. 28-62-20]|uniref:thioredoxin domain-containing protein n=1 Tax=unclassified Sphingomonas TaxID=196159 RepID=UPI000BDC59F7|nr:DsbA family protein [Sphingomonas sp.]OYY76775.1 MAG: protein-disulfide isomerase [Sphingomonas sp. 28-62-20]